MRTGCRRAATARPARAGGGGRARALAALVGELACTVVAADRQSKMTAIGVVVPQHVAQPVVANGRPRRGSAGPLGPLRTKRA